MKQMAACNHKLREGSTQLQIMILDLGLGPVYLSMLAHIRGPRSKTRFCCLVKTPLPGHREARRWAIVTIRAMLRPLASLAFWRCAPA